MDEYADGQAFYYDEEGTVNLRAAYNSSGKITGLSTLAEEEAQKIRAAFFQDDIKSEINSDNSDDDVNSESAPKENKFDSYAPFGITLNADKNIMYFNGQRVRLFVDKNESENYYYTAWQDQEGTVDLSVLRDSSGQIKYIVTLSKEAAQYYVKDIESAGMLSEDELNALEDKITQRVTEKMNEKYPQKLNEAIQSQQLPPKINDIVLPVCYNEITTFMTKEGTLCHLLNARNAAKRFQIRRPHVSTAVIPSTQTKAVIARQMS